MAQSALPFRRLLPAAALGLLLGLAAMPAAGLERGAPRTATPGDPALLCRAAIARVEQEAGLPAGLLMALGQVESGRRDAATGRIAPWPWTINAEGRGQFFPDRAAAIAAVRALQAQGVRRIDVGCLQVNLHFHPQAFASLEEAFDPLANARYAARFLQQLHAARPDWMVAAGHYHSHTPELADAYRARVRAAWPQTVARLAEDRALARGPAAHGAAPVPALSNRVDRAQIIPLAGGGGRGLDAYRAQPVVIAGRPPPLLQTRR